MTIFRHLPLSIAQVADTRMPTQPNKCHLHIVRSVKVNFLSYHYRADKSTMFGMRDLWGLTINSGTGAKLKYL